MSPSHFVYRFTAPDGTPMYVGYGDRPDRAEQHPGSSHNNELREWLSTHKYELMISGPYRDRSEGLAVESALIAALSPQFNRTRPSTFRPIGIPDHLVCRQSDPPISKDEVGLVTGGALMVRVKNGNADLGAALDLTSPDDTVITNHSRAWWCLGNMPTRWSQRPDESPRVLVAVAGPASAGRYVLAAFPIDCHGWGQAERECGLWKVPLPPRPTLDEYSLRGRRLSDVRFGRWRQDLVQVV